MLRAHCCCWYCRSQLSCWARLAAASTLHIPAASVLLLTLRNKHDYITNILNITLLPLLINPFLFPPVSRHCVPLQAASVLLASGLALSVAVQGAAAAPIRLEAKRVEQEEMLQQQLSKIEYLIQQQDNARKAELQGRCA